MGAGAAANGDAHIEVRGLIEVHRHLDELIGFAGEHSQATIKIASPTVFFPMKMP